MSFKGMSFPVMLRRLVAEQWSRDCMRLGDKVWHHLAPVITLDDDYTRPRESILCAAPGFGTAGHT